MIFMDNLLEAPEDGAGSYGLDDNKDRNVGQDKEESESKDKDEDKSQGQDGANINDMSSSTDSVSNDDSNETGNYSDDSSDGTVDEKSKIYLLAKAFQSLYNTSGTIISGIERLEFENSYKNDAKNYVANQLNTLKEVLYDYITITFKTKTYEQNLLYMEKYKSIVKTLIKTLKNVKDSE